MSEALHHLISPPQAFLSQESFPFHALLARQKIFFWEFPSDTAIPFLPHLLCRSFLSAKGTFSSWLP